MPPHVRLMASLRPVMGPAKFVTWTIYAADGRPSLAVPWSGWLPASSGSWPLRRRPGRPGRMAAAVLGSWEPEDDAMSISEVGHGGIDLDEAARQPEQEADDAQVAYETLSLATSTWRTPTPSPPARSRIAGWTSSGFT